MAAHAVAGGQGLVPAGNGWWCHAALGLGLALLGACAADTSPGQLMVGGGLEAGFAPGAPLRQAELWTAVAHAWAAPDDGNARLPPLPVLRPALALALPPPPKLTLPQPAAPGRLGWVPVPKPERPPAAPPPTGWHRAVWPPPPKPVLALLPAAVEPAAGPPVVEPATGAPVTQPVVVAHSERAWPALAERVAVATPDQLLAQLDRAARQALLAGDAATALGLYERLADRFPEERAVWLGRAIALERLGRNAEARALYQTLLGDDPEDLDAKVALLGLLAEAAPQEALGLLRRLAQHHPADGRLRAQIAMVLARQGALPAAIAEQRRAVALDPANPGYRINLAVLYDRAGGIEGAIEHYRSALELAALRGAPTAQLDAIATRLEHLRARRHQAAPGAPR